MIRGIEKQNKKMTRRADGRKEQKGNQKITKSQMETGRNEGITNYIVSPTFVCT